MAGSSATQARCPDYQDGPNLLVSQLRERRNVGVSVVGSVIFRLGVRLGGDRFPREDSRVRSSCVARERLARPRSGSPSCSSTSAACAGEVLVRGWCDGVCVDATSAVRREGAAPCATCSGRGD